MADKISVDRIDQMLRGVFQELKSMGGRARVKDLLAAVEPKLKLTDYEKGATQTGATRWSVHIGFYTGDCVGSGFLVKGDGQWTLTPEGEKALELPPGELIRTAQRDCAVSENALGDQGKNDGDDPREEAEPPAEYDVAREAARAEIRDELFGSPWDNALDWDYRFPDLELWHVCPGFLDPMADKLEEWTRNLDHTVEDFQKLAHFTDHMERMGNCASIAAWDRATVWLDVNVSVDFRETFEHGVRAVSEEAKEFLVLLSRLYLEGDPELWDGDRESSYAMATFEQNVCDKHLRYLRNTSQTQQGCRVTPNQDWIAYCRRSGSQRGR